MKKTTDRIPLVSCSGKAKFTSVIEARAVEKTANRRTDTARVAYKCEFCNCWHLGSGRSFYIKTKPRPTPKKLFSSLFG